VLRDAVEKLAGGAEESASMFLDEREWCGMEYFDIFGVEMSWDTIVEDEKRLHVLYLDQSVIVFQRYLIIGR
jgi:hypothetical protein